MRRAASIFALLALPTSLLAQEVVGTISGTIDAENASWSVHDGSDMETGWQDTDAGLSITLDAYPEATPPAPDELLRLRLRTAGMASAPDIAGAEISLASSDGTLLASGQNVDVSLTTLEVEGDSLVLSGNVVATMIEGGSEELLIGGDAGRTIDGNFQATILRAD